MQEVAILKAASDVMLDLNDYKSFKWVLICNDNTYVDIYELTALLSQISDSNVHYLGLPIDKKHRENDGGHSTKSYCISGPGYVLSMAAVQKLAPHLNDCAVNQLYANLGECVTKRLNVACWDDESAKQVPRDFTKFQHNLQEPPQWTNYKSITYYPIKTLSGLMKVYNDGQIDRDHPTTIDVGIVYACKPKRFKAFMSRANAVQSEKIWQGRVRFMLLDIPCKNPDDEVQFPSDINGFPLIVRRAENFTRSTCRNRLKKMTRRGAIFLVLDIDMQFSDTLFSNVLKIVKPGVAYFPIIWNRYSQKSIQAVEQTYHTIVKPFTKNEGVWRKYGYGMFAMHQIDADRFDLSEKFQKWGGEDTEFYERMRKNLNVVRTKETGLVHIWHHKDCGNDAGLVEEQFISCIHSKSSYMASKVGMMLLATKREESTIMDQERITIVVPLRSSNFSRVHTLKSTWLRDLPGNINVVFFISASIKEEAQLQFPELEFIFDTVGEEEYKPVVRNTNMLMRVLSERSFDWLLKANVDTYVNIENLQSLVYSFRTTKQAYLGSRGFGSLSDVKFLKFKKPFCLGGPGYLLRRQTLADLVQLLPKCISEANASQIREHLWHSDVMVGRCLLDATGLGCWEHDSTSIVKYSLNIFKQHYKNAKPIYSSVTYHPLKTEREMLEYHERVQERRDAKRISN